MAEASWKAQRQKGRGQGGPGAVTSRSWQEDWGPFFHPSVEKSKGDLGRSIYWKVPPGPHAAELSDGDRPCSGEPATVQPGNRVTVEGTHTAGPCDGPIRG